MIDYRFTGQAVKILKSGGTIIYPTETLWGIGCDATNTMAVKKVNNIKKRNESKGYIVMVDGFDMLSAYVGSLNYTVKEHLSSTIPTTVVFPKSSLLPSVVKGNDGSVAFRIAKTNICKELIRGLGKPIVSTSANLSNELPPLEKSKIAISILDSVDYVIDLANNTQLSMNPSRIISFDAQGLIKIIRE